MPSSTIPSVSQSRPQEMIEPGTAPPEPRRLSLGCVTGLVSGGGLALLALVLVAIVWGWRVGHQRAIATELKRLRDAAIPVTIEELDAIAATDPTRPDATEAWRAAIDAIQSAPATAALAALDSCSRDPDIGPRAIPIDVQAAFVTDQAAVYALLDAAVAQGTEANPAPISDLDAILMTPSASHFRAIARWLDHRLTYHLGTGDLDAAISDLEALHAVSAVVSRNPSVIGQLIGVAIEGMAHPAIAHLLMDHPLTEAQQSRLDSLLDQDLARSRLTRGLIGERVFALVVMNHMQDWHDQGNDPAFITQTYARSPLAILDQRLMLDHFRDVEMSLLAPTDAECLDAIEQAADTLDAEIEKGLIPPVMLGLAAPVFRMYASAAFRMDASRAVLRAGLAAQRFRQRSGAWPTGWDELASDCPGGVLLDPFDDQPLRLSRVDADGPLASVPNSIDDPDRPSGPGLLIHSIGTDRVDQGGLFDRSFGLEGGDIVLLLPDMPDPKRWTALAVEPSADQPPPSTEPSDAPDDADNP